MYFDLIVLLVIASFVFLYFRSFSAFVYLTAIADILLRLLSYVSTNLGVPELTALINRYFPKNIPAIIHNYTDGIFTDILMWAFFLIICIFEVYIIKTFINKKK